MKQNVHFLSSVFANLHTFSRHFEKVSHIFADAAFVLSFSSNYDDFQTILKKSEENLTKFCKNLLPLVNFDEVLLIFSQNGAKALKNEKFRNAIALIL